MLSPGQTDGVTVLMPAEGKAFTVTTTAVRGEAQVALSAAT